MDRLLALSLSDFNPSHDVAGAFLDALKVFTSWITSQIVHQLAALFQTLFDLITQEMLTTTPQFAHTKFNPVQPTLFSPVWGTMVKLAVVFAVLLMLVGVIAAVIRGEPGLLGKQLGLGFLGIVLMASPVIPDLVQALFDVIDVFSRYILSASLAAATHTALNAKMSLSSQITQAVANPFGGALEGSLLGAIVILLGCIAAVFIWFELLAREAIAYLIMALVPIALAGLFFKGTSRWIKKAIEGVIAVALAQIIIATVLSLAISSLLTSVKNNSITDAALFAIFMMIAAMGLPLAMRVAPMAFEFGEAALIGADVAKMARHHVGGGARAGAGAMSKGGGGGGPTPGGGGPTPGSGSGFGSGRGPDKWGMQDTIARMSDIKYGILQESTPGSTPAAPERIKPGPPPPDPPPPPTPYPDAIDVKSTIKPPPRPPLPPPRKAPPGSTPGSTPPPKGEK